MDIERLLPFQRALIAETGRAIEAEMVTSHAQREFSTFPIDLERLASASVALFVLPRPRAGIGGGTRGIGEAVPAPLDGTVVPGLLRERRAGRSLGSCSPFA